MLIALEQQTYQTNIQMLYIFSSIAKLCKESFAYFGIEMSEKE